MKGIILLSHGPMAKGLFETTHWFFGNEIEQYDYLCLQEEDQQAAFIEAIKQKITMNDTGDGVIIFADLFGGTPCNSCIDLLGDHVQLITGMNLTIVLELLANRLSDTYHFEDLLRAGKQGMVHVNRYQISSDDDFMD